MRFFIVTTIFTFSLFSIIGCKPYPANTITEQRKNPATHHDTNITKKPNQSELNQNSHSRSLEQEKYILLSSGIGKISLREKYNPNKFIKIEGDLEGADLCFYANSKEFPEYQNILSFQFFDDTLTGISISSIGATNFDKFKTYTGVKISDSVETIFKSHNAQPDEILKDPYTDEPVFIYWTDSTKTIGIRYDIFDDKVSSMGLFSEPHIRYFEGCG